MENFQFPNLWCKILHRPLVEEMSLGMMSLPIAFLAEQDYLSAKDIQPLVAFENN